MTKWKLTEEDKKLFRSEIKDVLPLKHKKKLSESSDKQNKLPSRQVFENPYTNQILTPPPYPTEIANPVHAEEVIAYRSSYLPEKIFKKLSAGKIPFKGRIDLHRKTQDEAADALYKFITHQQKQGGHCVLIVHGKGSYSSEPPILKNLVNKWLRELPEISGFHSALPKHGGAGAIYAIIKQKK